MQNESDTTKSDTLKIQNHDLDTLDIKNNRKKHGVLFPDTVRGIITGPSNCGKTNAMLSVIEHENSDTVRGIITGPSNCGKTNAMLSVIEHENGLKFENIYLYSKSLNQPKYVYLEKLLKPISILRKVIKTDKSMGRHNDIDCFYLSQTYAKVPKHLIRDNCFYLSQTYAKVPKHLIRDNANIIVLFKQDDLNLKHVYTDHVGTDMSFEQFKDMCSLCWKEPYSFITYIRIIKSIKNKLNILKHGEIAKEKVFLPITKHLKQIEHKLDGKKVDINDSSIVKKNIDNEVADMKFVTDEIMKAEEDLLTPSFTTASSSKLDFLNSNS
ncbi:hypothetical protein QE152_g10040 [Popillia japonica]|uniref:G domain-containing protein n=1 Tax=Popillia japonica TaxID=7064 RepID=A0AAW1LSQ8_POPJA